MTEHAMQAYFELHAEVSKRAEFIIDRFAPSSRYNTAFRLGDRFQRPGQDEEVEVEYHDGHDGCYEQVPLKWFWMDPDDVVADIARKHAEKEAERARERAAAAKQMEDRERELLAKLKEKYDS